jgi:hypothetical protein
MPAGWLLALTLSLTGPGGAPIALDRDEFGRVAVGVRLGASEPYRFLLDTGASLSSVSPRVARRLGLIRAGNVRATSVGANGTLELVRPPALVLGTRRLAVPWMVVLPERVDHPLSRFDGILGQDALRQFSYLIDVTAGRLWIDPRTDTLLALDGLVALDRPSRTGPLTIADATGARWALDSGASHVVLFKDQVRASGVAVRIESALGLRGGTWAGKAALQLGEVTVSWTRSVAASVEGRAERGLLPLALFDAVYVDNRRGTAHVVVRGAAGKPCHPDVAARFGALEDDGRIAGRPRGVTHVPPDALEARQLLDPPRRRRQ